MGVPATTGVLRNQFDDMDIGDYIACSYTNNSLYAIGNLNYLGDDSKAEMPLGRKSGASQKFYLVKVAKGLLISDRVIQNSVTWTVLNSSRLIQGRLSTDGIFNGINPPKFEFVIRSLTGGVGFADEDGNMSSSHSGNFGGFPTNNEFDRYLVNFPVENIQIGKTLDDVFNCSRLTLNPYTWCQDSPSISIGDNTIRTARATDVNGSVYASQINTSATVDYGFRPVFDYNENLLKQ